MFTAIVIDDDPSSRELVNELVKQYFPEIHMVAEAGLLYQGIKEIYKHQPNIVFLDMQLPDGLGYEIFNFTFLNPIKVIFITAHKDYAYDAINYSPAGYLVKPVNAGYFVNSIMKALDMVDYTRTVAVDNHQKSVRFENDKIVVKTTESIHIIKKELIVRCEASRNYTTIYQKDEKGILASQTLKDFEAMLPYPQFIRVHQSHLVNTFYIKRIDKADCCLLMADNSRIPIAYRKREQLMDYVKHIAS